MLEWTEERNGGVLELALTGRLDTTSSPQLEKVLMEEIPFTDRLVLDLEGLEYISSAGLRVLLVTEKKMKKKGRMILRHVGGTVADVMAVTGFDTILTVED